MNLPLSVYDILGYLASGFIVLAAAEFGFDGDWLLNREWKPGAIGLYVTLAYLIGHLVANVSSYLIEHKLGRGWLGCSEDLLFGKAKGLGESLRWREWFFPGFYRPLPEKTKERILKAAEPEGLNEPGRALYLHAWAVVKQDKSVLERLNTFLALYGFCRNTCLALLLAVAIIAASGVWYRVAIGAGVPAWHKVGIALLGVGGAVGMLYRYLKFYRHYTLEVLVNYPELKKPKDTKDKPKE